MEKSRMRLSAVKKELSGRGSSSSLAVDLAPAFDRQRLVQELLSLGNSKIDAKLAENIGLEVEAELKRRSFRNLGPELVSELVQFKLEELGLIEIRRRRARRASAFDAEKQRHSQAEIEVSETTPTLTAELPLAGSLAQKVEASKLPTLEKFLAPTEARSLRPSAPLPPKANLKVSARTLKKLVARIEGPMGREAENVATAQLEAVFEDLAKLAAGIQADRESVQASTLAVQFFNSLANQEFYPHHPRLLNFLGVEAKAPEVPEEILLSEEPTERATILRQAAKAWKEGREVSFLLPQGQSVGWTGEDFERFLDKAEKAILELPEGAAMPKRIAFRLRLDDPRALDFAQRALSGKYYPKFAFDWLLPEEFSFDDSTAERFEDVLIMTWKKSEPSLVFSAKAFGAPDPSRLGFPETARPGGAPALSPTGEAPLGSLNLSIVGAGGDVDWAKLKRMTHTALRFLDGLAAAGKAKKPRALGLGAMGFAELLVKLGIPYDSDTAVDLAEKIARFLRQEATQAAQALIEEAEPPRAAHSALLAFQNEAGLAEMAEVSAGFLPIERLLEGGQVAPLLRHIAERRKVWTPQVEAEVLELGSLRQAPSAPKPLRRLFASREEIDPEWQLRIQGALERHSDAFAWTSAAFAEELDLAGLKERLAQLRAYGLRALRLPQNPDFEAPERETTAPSAEEIEVTQVEASDPAAEASEPAESESPRAAETIATEAAAASLALTLEELANESPAAEEAEAEDAAPELPADSLAAAILGLEDGPAKDPAPAQTKVRPRERPEVLQARSRLIHTGCGPLHVSFARDEQGPYEVRAQLGQPGTCAHTQTEAISRLISLCLSSGIDQRLVHQQIRGLRCETSTYDRGERILGCVDGIAKVFEREGGVDEEEPTCSGLEKDEITAVTSLKDLN